MGNFKNYLFTLNESLFTYEELLYVPYESLKELPPLEPTQKEINDDFYTKYKVKFNLFDSEYIVAIENISGSYRKGIDKDGDEWKSLMKHHYGEILDIRAYDGDFVDVFLNSNASKKQIENRDVYVIHQTNASSIEPYSKAVVTDGKFDEHKLVLGASSKEDAEEIYTSNYDKGWNHFSHIEKVPRNEFLNWLRNLDSMSQLVHERLED